MWTVILIVAAFIGGTLVRFGANQVLAAYWAPHGKRLEGYLRNRRLERESKALEQGSITLDSFRLSASYTAAFTIVDGAGDAPIKRSNLSAHVTPEDVVIPPVFAAWQEEERARIDRHDGHSWNNPRYAVKGYTVSRRGIDEDPVFQFELVHSDYVNFLATQRLDDSLPDGTTPRQAFLAGRQPDELPAFMCNSLGAHVAVVTADGYLVVRRRSLKVKVQPGRLGATVSEGLSRGNDNHGQGAPDLWGVAVRGLEEEVGLLPHEYQLNLLCIGLATDVQQWVMLFVAELPTMTAPQLEARMSRGARDDWEHSKAHDLVPFTPEAVLAYITDPNRWEDLLSVAPPLFYHALVHRFGRRRVEKALRAYDVGAA